MTLKNKKLDAVFFKTENNVEPVRDWLKELPKADKKCIGEDIATVQFGWPTWNAISRSSWQWFMGS